MKPSSRRHGKQQDKKPKEDTGGPDNHLHLLQLHNAGLLKTEGYDKTYRVTQDRLQEHLSLQTAKKRFSLKLDKGPYTFDYSRNGRSLLVAGAHGHVAMMDWQKGKLNCELQLEEQVRAAHWLQDEQLFAVSQERYTFIYDNVGKEIHRLDRHTEVHTLDYLPFHFLLVSAGGKKETLCYSDITNGKVVGEHHLQYTSDSATHHLGRCTAMRVNQANGIVGVGHASGQFTLWSPTVGSALVTMQCHTGPLQAIAFDLAGVQVATAGLDGKISIWDMRAYKKLYDYRPLRPVTSLDFSQRGLLAAAYGPHAVVWPVATGTVSLEEKGAEKFTRSRNPYMHHLQEGTIIKTIRFCPFDDILGVGHGGGFDSIIIPGSGEPNYDAFEVNPMATTKQRREAEVKQLLDKLEPETITLDPLDVGGLIREPTELKEWLKHKSKAVEGETGEESRRKRKKKDPRHDKGVAEKMRRREQLAKMEEERKLQRQEQKEMTRRKKLSADGTKGNPLERFVLKQA